MSDLVNLGAKLEIDGLNEFLRGMKKVAGAADAAADRNEKLAAKKKKTSDFFAAVTAGSTAATAAMHASALAFRAVGRGADLAFGAVSKFADFDLQVARVASLLPQSAGLMDDLTGKVNKLAVTFGQDGASAANAFFDAISAGVSEADSEGFVATASKLAVAGSTDVSTTVLGLTKVINGFRLGVGEAESVADAFFITNKLGVTTVEQLARGIGQVAPSANALGISYKELLSVTATMTKAGIDTSTTFASLKQVFSNILKPSKDAADTAKRLGIEFNASALKAKGYAGFMADLATKTAGNVDAQAALFGSMESFNAVATVVSEGGARDLSGALQQMETGAGTVTHEFGRMSERVGFSIQQIRVGLDQLAVGIGGGLAEGLGLDELDDVPATMLRVSEVGKEAAASFARAFKDAFGPFADFDEVDFTKAAAGLGTSAGQLIEVMSELAGVLNRLLLKSGGLQAMANILRDVSTGDFRSEAERAAAAQGDEFINRDEIRDEFINTDIERRIRENPSLRMNREVAAFAARNDPTLDARVDAAVLRRRMAAQRRAGARDSAMALKEDLAAINDNPSYFTHDSSVLGDVSGVEPAQMTPAPVEITRNLTIIMPDGEGGSTTLTSTTKDNWRGRGDAAPVRTRESRGGVTVDDELELAGPGG
ncbi:MAG: phage tail tape measure protein [Dehalococcoidia bacterium]